MSRFISEQVALTEVERQEIRQRRIQEAKEELDAAEISYQEVLAQEPPTHRTVLVKIGPEDPRYETAPFEDQMRGSLQEVSNPPMFRGSVFSLLLNKGKFPRWMDRVTRSIES